MNTVRVEATVQSDGELQLTNLPCRRGDKVEAVIRVVPPEAGREAARAAALAQYLALAQSSTFRSVGPYPSRDELHERH